MDLIDYVDLEVYNKGFIDGQWDAFDTILNWINTFQEQEMDKSKLYKYVMELRPKRAYT